MNIFSIKSAIIQTIVYDNVTNNFNFVFQLIDNIVDKRITLIYTPQNSYYP
jgi:hypothetical protein